MSYTIQQFYDKGLAHASYVIIDGDKAAVIDPERDVQPYIDFANQLAASIVAIIETHPHADFVSGHLELHQATRASIYCSKLLGATYAHTPFDDGDIITLNTTQLAAINTPGHSPDSICVALITAEASIDAVFTGDTLFIGDCGRPDLRENVGNTVAAAEMLAKQMYHSLNVKLAQLPDHTVVYPTHGAGSLCGKNLSSDTSSTMLRERATNPALQPTNETDFLKYILTDQPFVPKYFENSVQLNKRGAPSLAQALQHLETDSIHCTGCLGKIKKDVLIIDARAQSEFKKSSLPNSINLQEGGKFETWLGAIVSPNEPFYLIAKDDTTLHYLLSRIAKIGYENQVQGLFTTQYGSLTMPIFDQQHFDNNPNSYTLLDVRNHNEVKQGPLLPNAIAIPLPELRDRWQELPTHLPIAIHCAAGYRSAAAQSILFNHLSLQLFDIGEKINEYKQ